MKRPQEVDPPAESPSGALGWALPVGFLVFAGVLFAAPKRAPAPLTPSKAVAPAALAVGPRRTAMTDPAHTSIEGRPEHCNACHQIFKSLNAGGAAPTFHTQVRLVHGLNDRCMNCHDYTDRERLTLRDGETVTFSEAPLLCAQCHGTVFRDWERGTHGKTLGSWKAESPRRVRLICSECHDPHAPKYPKIEPLPGPTTLRMGDQTPSPHVAPDDNSLQRWLRQARSVQSPASTADHGGHP